LNSAAGGRKNWGYPQHIVDSPFIFSKLSELFLM